MFLCVFCSGHVVYQNDNSDFHKNASYKESLGVLRLYFDPSSNSISIIIFISVVDIVNFNMPKSGPSFSSPYPTSSPPFPSLSLSPRFFPSSLLQCLFLFYLLLLILILLHLNLPFHLQLPLHLNLND